MRKKAQKHGMQLHNCCVAVMRFGTEMHMLSTGHGTVAAQIYLNIIYTSRWEGAKPSLGPSAKPYWFRDSSLYQSKLGMG